MNANLIACARYCVMDEFEKMREELRAPIHVVFIVQLPRGASFTGFQVSKANLTMHLRIIKAIEFCVNFFLMHFVCVFPSQWVFL
jgi:hypothetical protein